MAMCIVEVWSFLWVVSMINSLKNIVIPFICLSIMGILILGKTSLLCKVPWCDVYEYGNGCLSWWDVDDFIAPTSTYSLLSWVQLLWLSNSHMLCVSHAATVNSEEQNSHEYQRPHKNSVHLTHWTLPDNGCSFKCVNFKLNSVEGLMWWAYAVLEWMPHGRSHLWQANICLYDWCHQIKISNAIWHQQVPKKWMLIVVVLTKSQYISIQ